MKEIQLKGIKKYKKNLKIASQQMPKISYRIHLEEIIGEKCTDFLL